jgi:hypothetical protein
MACQATTTPGTISASLPPAMAMSTSPRCTALAASAIAADDEAQATEYVSTGPCTPRRMATWAAGALGMKAGMVSGDTRPLPR